MENTKGICLIRMENGREIYQPKTAYLRMKKAGRIVELIEEAPNMEELKRKLGRV